MKQHETFVFDSYGFDPERLEITLRYTLDDEVRFEEKIKLKKRGLAFEKTDPGLLDRALFALHLAGGVSYYKTCCPKTIVVRSGGLTPTQAKFWNEFYESGLGEFFYRNSIDFRGLIAFPSGDAPQPTYVAHSFRKNAVLVPIGGGKDSVVTLELLKAAGLPITLFRMGSHPLIAETARVADRPLLAVERTLDPQLLALNEQGAPNGHVPITGYLMFLSVVIGLLYRHGAIAFSNERSANVGSTLYCGKDINHQWSKSLAAEQLIQDYVRSWITPDIQLFSLLRPLSELAVTQQFCQYPDYRACATSCNRNWTIAARHRPGTSGPPWCRRCPKCAFVFTMLAAFLPRADVLLTFGGDLFADPHLSTMYRELLGLEGIKPFDCVGTPDETKAAFILAHRKGEFADAPLLQEFVRDVLPTIENPDALITEALRPSHEHVIPPEFATVLPEA